MPIVRKEGSEETRICFGSSYSGITSHSQVCSHSYRRAVAVLLVLIFIASPASSTVILLLVTPDAVVIAADSKSTTFSNGSPIHVGEHEKVVSIAKGQIIIGDVGLAKIERYDVLQEIYSFPTWARALNIEEEAPIMQVASTVASDSYKIMKTNLSQKLRDGTFSPKTMGQTNPFLPLVGYYIGKCDIIRMFGSQH